jgi:hypothetical protein
LENTVGKLWALGLGKGFPEIDECIKSYIDIMEQDFNRKDVNRIGYGVYYLAQFLSLIGYADEEPIANILQMRLDQIYNFVKQERYDIYVDAKGYPKLPSSWKSFGKIIDPELTHYGDPAGEPPLPSLYDLLGILGMKRAGMTKENEIKANSILQYCYDERYQKTIMYKYGIVLAPSGQYYSMGWSVHLPGYGQKLDKDIEINKLLLWADILSSFTVSRKFDLMRDLIDFLEKFKTTDGFFKFPRRFIPEEKNGYFISGKYMGLGEDRLQTDACLIESTFRVLKLKKNLGFFE